MKKKIGDIYSLPIDGNVQRYFQFIASDATQLDSSVIRVFKKSYELNAKPDVEEIVNNEVDFYAHVAFPFFKKAHQLKKIGNSPEIGKLDILFRDSSDYGKGRVDVSEKWWVWKINGPQQHVGKLQGENQNAEIGIVLRPKDIIDRMLTGKYQFVYPGF